MRVGRVSKGSMFRQSQFYGTAFFWSDKGSGDCIYAMSSEASSHQVLKDFLSYYDIENRKNHLSSNSMVRFFCDPKDAYYLKKELSSRGFLFKFRTANSDRPVDIMIDTAIESFKVAGGISTKAQSQKKIAAVFEKQSEASRIKDAFANNSDFDFHFLMSSSKSLTNDILQIQPDALLFSLDLLIRPTEQILKEIYAKKFFPTIITSFKAERKSESYVKCFELGASDFLSISRDSEIEVLLQQKFYNCIESEGPRPSPAPISAPKQLVFASSDGVVCFGASTGGTEAVRGILKVLPEEGPPIVVAQHIPKYFAAAFTESLQRSTKKTVVEIKNGMELKANCVYLPPGGRHVRIEGHAGKARLALTEPQAELNYVPSVDLLFESAATVFKDKVYAVILTGMGRDGVLGCAEIKRAGGSVIAQNKETCVVYGMPRVVIEQDLADVISPLEAVSDYLIKMVA